MKRLFLLLIIPMVIVAEGKTDDNVLGPEDLIPGGRNYQKYIPRLKTNYVWYGDKYVTIGRDTMYWYDPLKPKRKNILLTNRELRSFLSDENVSISQIRFVNTGDHTVAEIYSGEKESTVFFDPERKKIIFEIPGEKDAETPDYAFQSQSLAFTKENNLFVVGSGKEVKTVWEEEDPGIVSGREVSRNEFGIYKGTFWSPSGNLLAFYRKDERKVKDYPLVNIAARQATLKNIKYPMAGMKSQEISVGIYDLKTEKTLFLKTGTPKDRYFTNLTWSPDEKGIYIAEINRGQDTCTIVRYHVATGKREAVLFQEINSKYVEPQSPLLFLKKSPGTFIWESRRSGFNHLYLYNTDGTLIRQLTSGEFEVLKVIGLDKDENAVFIVSNEGNPIEERIYKVDIKTGKRIRLSTASGINHPTLSASGKYILNEFSSLNVAKRLELIETSGGKTRVLSEAEDPLKNRKMPEITMGTLKAADGTTDLYYRLIKPVDFDETRKYPVIVYVYGGPHSQLVKNTRWGAAPGWHIYMALKGYVVFTLDNRGTNNRGRDFENIIHRKLGVIEAEDQMKGIEYLKSLSYIDSERIGVHGWSYGGFMTVNLMLRYPETFKVGVAGGPVIDWKYYEVMYGERYMDTPKENKEGYEDTNMNLRAGDLKGRLLLIHGDEDPVVVWQHSLSFLAACVKQNTFPDYFVYPGHEHNIIGRDRVHLHEKITRYFEDYLK
jgi:Dipeptidyl aminopeptidases/acylaminoacyl-peptidases